MKRAIILFILLTVPSLSFSATIHVPADYATIQEAIDAAVNRDTVMVAPDTYFENINFKGKAITVTSSDGPETTVIDGSHSGCVVSLGNFEGRNSVIAGFTITNGFAGHSAGIYCNGSPQIIGNIIENNTAGDAAGIGCPANVNASPTISNNIIRKNIATGSSGGGGLGFGSSCFPEISNNIIMENEATNAGGAIGFYDNSKLILINNVIAMNKAGYAGGGIAGSGSSLLLVNNTLYGNWADVGGGALGFANGCDALFLNNTVVDNSAGLRGGGINFNNDCTVQITNTIFWGNNAPVGPEIMVVADPNPSTLDISYSDVYGGKASIYVESGCTMNWGSGMIDADPLFVDSANDDFHLAYTSPCKDTGDNTAITESNDFEGDPRIAYGTVDMGADEFYTHLYVTGDQTPGGSIQGKFVGLPGTNPVGLFIGSGVLPSPVTTMWGEYWLQSPWILLAPLLSIPADGVMVLPTTIPPGMTAPVDIPMQALIGLNTDSLTNLCVLEVR